MTEQEYFDSLAVHCRNPLVARVDVVVDGPSGVPWSLVNKARELKSTADQEAHHEKDDNLRFEEVWCVFDVDEHPKIGESRQFAQSHGLSLAMSNPCFELWLLLHFRESPGMQHRHDVQALLKPLMPGVDDKHIDFPACVRGIEEAVQRAERLEVDAREANESTRNPTTEVWHLVDSIDQAGRDRRIKARHDRKSRGLEKAEAAARAAELQAAKELLAFGDREPDDPSGGVGR